MFSNFTIHTNIKAIIFSRGILGLDNLVEFLCHFTDERADVVHVIGWGFKPTAKRARDYAAKHNLPYVALEDGFLRSVGLGVAGTQPLSLVVDEVGIYYDARQPSKLEQLILTNGVLDEVEVKRAEMCMSAIRQFRLSKYNQNQHDATLIAAKPKVVVIDQTVGDASVEGAQATAETFVAMLQCALTSHPNETIWVKVHPDVLHGKKKGFLYPLPLEHSRIRLYAESVNPWDFLDSVEHVYTVSSLMGFEALMAGCQVHCFGLPFYAGWGLTQDQQECPRRNQPRTLAQVFYSAYIEYARYVDPILAQRCEIEQTIAYMAEELKRQALPLVNVSLIQLSWWKQRWIGDYLAAWRFKPSRTLSNAGLAWGRAALQADCYCIEDGFIRSVGLGVHFNRPVSLVCDKRGIYFDGRSESDLEHMLQHGELSVWDRARAERLIQQLLAAKLTKYNVGSAQVPTVPADKKVILVPGQVESDASIAFGSPMIKTNAELLAAVRKAEPDAYIIYKPHPDVLAGQRDEGQWQGDFIQYADYVETDVAMAILLEQVDEVHTLTSLAGFEALLRGKGVTTYGMPFYAGWGLTQDNLACSRRTRQHSLASLVFFTLIEYPTYVDPITHKAMTAEQGIARIGQLKQGDVTVRDNKLACLLALKRVKQAFKGVISPFFAHLKN